MLVYCAEFETSQQEQQIQNELDKIKGIITLASTELLHKARNKSVNKLCFFKRA